MDWQSAFNIAAGLSGFLGGWWLRVLWDAQKELRKEMGALKDHLTENYVRRDDFKDIVKTLFDKLDRIETKLDQKADK